MTSYSDYKEALDKEGYIIHGFVGFSMYPTFIKDDLLLIVKKDNYSLYDIVLYKVDDKYIAHRIVDIKDNHYIIRGDNAITDEIVSFDSVLGYVKSIYRNGKQIELYSSLNESDYKKSYKSLKYRRFKNKVRRLFK